MSLELPSPGSRSGLCWDTHQVSKAVGKRHLTPCYPTLESVLQQHLHAYAVGKSILTVVCIEKGT